MRNDLQIPDGYSIHRSGNKSAGLWRFWIDCWAGRSLPYLTRAACERAARLHARLFNKEN